MKIKLSEEQLRKLVEQKISYTPEKIDEFVEHAMKVLENVQQIRNKYYNNVVTLTISEVMQEKNVHQKMVKEISEQHTRFNEQHTKFFNIVEMYDFLDMPNNVKQLEKINDKIEKYSEDMYYIGNALEDIINAVEYIERTEN
jgi:hypothetical protein